MQPQQRAQQSPGTSAWAADFASTVPQQITGKGKGRAFDADQFVVQQQQQQPQQCSQQAPQYDSYSQGMGMYGAPGIGMGMGMGMGMGSMMGRPFEPMYGQAIPQQQQAQVVPVEGEMLSEQDLNAAFDDVLKQQQEQPKEAEASEAKEAEQENGPTSSGPDFEAVWNSLRPEGESDRLSKLAEWEAEYSQFTNGEHDYDYDLNGVNGDFGDDFNLNMPGESANGVQIGPDGRAVLDNYDFGEPTSSGCSPRAWLNLFRLQPPTTPTRPTQTRFSVLSTY